MKKKPTPKVTITKRHHEQLKEDSKALGAIARLLGMPIAHASPAVAKVAQLMVTEKSVKQIYGDEKADIDVAMASIKDAVKAYTMEIVPTLRAMRQMLNMEFISQEGTQLAEHIQQEVFAMIAFIDHIAEQYEVDTGRWTAFRKLKIIDKKRCDQIKALDRGNTRLTRRNDRLKEALRSSLHTNTTVAAVIGQFEEEDEGMDD